jgi:hypothetical protein
MINSQIEQLKSLAEKLASKEENLTLISQNKELIKDALECFSNQSYQSAANLLHFELRNNEQRTWIEDISDNFTKQVIISDLPQPSAPKESMPGFSQP